MGNHLRGDRLFPRTIRVLVVEDEEYDVRRLRSTLKPFEDQIAIVDVVASGDAALNLLEQKTNQFDLVIMDLQLAGGLMGEALIRAIKRIAPSVQIIVMTKMTINVTDFDFANRLLSAGAFWYCTKYPADIEEYIYQPTDLILSIFNAYQRKALLHEQSKSLSKLQRDVEEKLAQTRILGISPQIQKLRAQIKQLAISDATVLITGASGTGKELVAKNIHYESRRRIENFVAIQCGSIPVDLIESALFGHEQGSFTGATNAKAGFFEAAHHGTLFLDEVTDLPLSAQVKLLRVIQEGEIEKIGRTEKVKVDVRIIASTNKILQKEVSAGRFREDLFYRLNVVPISVPLLRDRPEDIAVLWEHYMERMSVETERPAPRTDEAVFNVLAKYAWPGNVRELKNVVQRLVLQGHETIDEAIIGDLLLIHSGSSLVDRPDGVIFHDSDSTVPLRDLEHQLRRKYFEYIRKKSTSDAEAARKLGLAPPNYHRMCKELGIKE
ncbi:MAG TPA: sigma-54 dependent transcriptional regulator [Bacteroidota bacterium]